MTLREFIRAHPRAALEIWTDHGVTRLEPRQAQKLLEGGHVICVPEKNLKQASYVPGEELLELPVCSGIRQGEFWRIHAACDPMEKQGRERMARLAEARRSQRMNM